MPALRVERRGWARSRGAPSGAESPVLDRSMSGGAAELGRSIPVREASGNDRYVRILAIAWRIGEGPQPALLALPVGYQTFDLNHKPGGIL
jgi:hypothetical protein